MFTTFLYNDQHRQSEIAPNSRLCELRDIASSLFFNTADGAGAINVAFIEPGGEEIVIFSDDELQDILLRSQQSNTPLTFKILGKDGSSTEMKSFGTDQNPDAAAKKRKRTENDLALSLPSEIVYESSGASYSASISTPPVGTSESSVTDFLEEGNSPSSAATGDTRSNGKRSRNNYTLKDQHEVMRLKYELKWSQEKIAKHFNMPGYYTVRGITERCRKNIKQKRKEGLSVAALAKYYSLSERTIESICGGIESPSRLAADSVDNEDTSPGPALISHTEQENRVRRSYKTKAIKLNGQITRVITNQVQQFRDEIEADEVSDQANLTSRLREAIVIDDDFIDRCIRDLNERMATNHTFTANQKTKHKKFASDFLEAELNAATSRTSQRDEEMEMVLDDTNEGNVVTVNTSTQRVIRSFQFDGWYLTDIKPFNKKKDEIPESDDETRVVVLIEDINQCTPKVQLHAFFSRNRSEAATEFNLIRQKIENEIYNDREFARGRGKAGGDYRYLTRKGIHNGESAASAKPIIRIDVVRSNDDLHGYHGCTPNLNEGRCLKFLCLAWQQEETLSPCPLDCPKSFVDVPLLHNFGSRDSMDCNSTIMSCDSATTSGRGKKSGKKNKKMKFDENDADQGLLNRLVIFCFRYQRLAEFVTVVLMFFDALISLIFRIIQGAPSDSKLVFDSQKLLSDDRFLKRLDRRLQKVIKEGRLLLYLRNVMLIAIIRFGDANALCNFFKYQRPFYEGLGIWDCINQYIYDGTSQNDTPLLLSVGLCRKEIVQWLLDNGADPSQRELEGEYPSCSGLDVLEVARRMNNLQLEETTEIEAMIENHRRRGPQQSNHSDVRNIDHVLLSFVNFCLPMNFVPTSSSSNVVTQHHNPNVLVTTNAIEVTTMQSHAMQLPQQSNSTNSNHLPPEMNWNDELDEWDNRALNFYNQIGNEVDPIVDENDLNIFDPFYDEDEDMLDAILEDDILDPDNHN